MAPNTAIFYFSGTGNSLVCAQALAQGLGNAKVLPLAAFREQARIPVEADRVGIVCPVYFYTLPLIVREFLPKLDLSRARYVFLAVTMGGFPGLALVHGQEILARSGANLHAGFAVRMYPNYIAAYDPRKLGSRVRMERNLAKAVPKIVAAVRAEQRVPVRSSLTGRVFFAALGRNFLATCRTRDRSFYADSRCNGCGTCVQVCPVGNVELNQGYPRWLGHCEQCLACLHFCPTEAIQIRGRPTQRRGRYHHPQVTAAEIATQRLLPPSL